MMIDLEADGSVVSRTHWLLLPLGFGCEEMHESWHQHHDHLRHDAVFEKEQRVEEKRRSGGHGEAVDVVQGYGGQGQTEGPGNPRKSPSAGLPVLSESQTQQNPGVTAQRREGCRVHTDPLGARAPSLSQRDGPAGHRRTL